MVNVLFLGAGKRLSLLESFQAAAERENIALSLFAMEREVHVPIALVAAVFAGPSFRDVHFPEALCQAVDEYRIDIVIPNMDAATVALAAAPATGAWHLVSSLPLCQAMEDKRASEAWFRAQGLPIPDGDGWPRIAKSRLGFGARDQFIIPDPTAWEAAESRLQAGDYLIQPWIPGREYTVDAYVAQDGRILGIYIRQRLEVVNGEVDVSLSQHHPGIEALTRRILGLPGWLGPITLQFIDGPEGPVLIEINPRFGGGVTHAIHGGLDMPAWILREWSGRPVTPCEGWKEGSLMTRCRRDVFHDPHD